MGYYDYTSEQLALIPEAIRDYDWCEAFAYAPPGVGITDVAEVVASSDGCHDADNWVGVFKLHDGRFLYLSAGCDYTGWDCQAGGAGELRATLAEIVREACGDEDRGRLGLKLEVT
jgi:hypothetical protein